MVDERISPPTIKASEPMRVGGAEGEKVMLEIPVEGPVREGEEKLPPAHLVRKEYYTEESASGSVKYINRLRDLGYPVVQFAGYYQEGDKFYVLMADATDGGNKLVWGLNGSADATEMETLKQMSLTEVDLLKIEQTIKDMMEKSFSDGVRLLGDFFHLSKDKITGKLDIILLDIRQPSEYEMDMTNPHELLSAKSSATIFIDQVSRNLASKILN